jgi:hypothetical protein
MSTHTSAMSTQYFQTERGGGGMEKEGEWEIIKDTFKYHDVYNKIKNIYF